MEKYINHDLGIIQEQVFKVTSPTTVNLKYLKNKALQDMTRSKHYYDEKYDKKSIS